jgi:hypothetical protein
MINNSFFDHTSLKKSTLKRLLPDHRLPQKTVKVFSKDTDENSSGIYLSAEKHIL